MSAGLDRACIECGAPIAADSKATDFCSRSCKRCWNNRRLKRGAAFLDLYMAHRFDRGEAQKLGVFQAINRRAADFRLEDRRVGAGRRAGRVRGAVLAERPYLKAVVTYDGTGRGGAQR